jgi:hypothetical protein
MNRTKKGDSDSRGELRACTGETNKGKNISD